MTLDPASLLDGTTVKTDSAKTGSSAEMATLMATLGVKLDTMIKNNATYVDKIITAYVATRRRFQQPVDNKIIGTLDKIHKAILAGSKSPAGSGAGSGAGGAGATSSIVAAISSGLKGGGGSGGKGASAAAASGSGGGVVSTTNLQTATKMQAVMNTLDKVSGAIRDNFQEFNVLNNATKGIFSDELDFMMKMRQTAYTTMGITGEQTKAQQKLIDLEGVVAMTGMRREETQKRYLASIKKGASINEKDLVTGNRALNITKSVLAASTSISDSVEEALSIASEMEGSLQNWQFSLGLNQTQIGQISRGLSSIARDTGVTGHNLAAVVKSSETFMKNLRDSSNLTAEAAKNIISMRASAQKFGIGEEADQLMGALSSQHDFYMKSSSGTKLYLSLLGQVSGQMDKIQSGTLLKSKEGLKAAAQSADEAFRITTGHTVAAYKELDATQKSLIATRLKAGGIISPYAQLQFKKTLEEASKSYVEKIAAITKQGNMGDKDDKIAANKKLIQLRATEGMSYIEKWHETMTESGATLQDAFKQSSADIDKKDFGTSALSAGLATAKAISDRGGKDFSSHITKALQSGDAEVLEGTMAKMNEELARLTTEEQRAADPINDLGLKIMKLNETLKMWILPVLGTIAASLAWLAWGGGIAMLASSLWSTGRNIWSLGSMIKNFFTGGSAAATAATAAPAAAATAATAAPAATATAKAAPSLASKLFPTATQTATKALSPATVSATEAALAAIPGAAAVPGATATAAGGQAIAQGSKMVAAKAGLQIAGKVLGGAVAAGGLAYGGYTGWNEAEETGRSKLGAGALGVLTGNAKTGAEGGSALAEMAGAKSKGAKNAWGVAGSAAAGAATGAGIGALLAPFTFGMSILVGGAIGGVVGAGAELLKVATAKESIDEKAATAAEEAAKANNEVAKTDFASWEELLLKTIPLGVQLGMQEVMPSRLAMENLKVPEVPSDKTAIANAATGAGKVDERGSMGAIGKALALSVPIIGTTIAGLDLFDTFFRNNTANKNEEQGSMGAISKALAVSVPFLGPSIADGLSLLFNNNEANTRTVGRGGVQPTALGDVHNRLQAQQASAQDGSLSVRSAELENIENYNKSQLEELKEMNKRLIELITAIKPEAGSILKNTVNHEKIMDSYADTPSFGDYGLWPNGSASTDPARGAMYPNV